MKNKCISTERGIACIMVILIHCRFPGVFGGIVTAISRTAVFYFFIVSGYFSYKKDDTVFFTGLYRQSIKLLRITTVAFILGTIWRILLAGFGSSGSLDNLIVEWTDTSRLLSLLIWQNDIILGPYWFLLSLLLCYPACFLLRKLKSENIFLLLSLLIIINLGICKFCPAINIHYYRNFWLTGLPFFSAGYYIHMITSKKGVAVSDCFSIILAFVGILLTIIEYFIEGSKLMYAGNLLLLAGALLYALYNNQKEIIQISEIGEKYSLYIYILHWYVIDILTIIARHSGVESQTYYLYSRPVFVVMGTLAVSVIYRRLSQFISSVVIK